MATTTEKAELKKMCQELISKEMEEYSVTIAAEDVVPHAEPIIRAAETRINEMVAAACTATEARVSAHYEAKIGELRLILESALATSEPMAPARRAAVKAAVTGVDPEDEFTKFLVRYARPGASMGPIIVRGGQGSGKTTTSKNFAFRAGFQEVIVVPGHSGLEAMDFIGGLRPHDGRTIWQDGPITAAFRLSAEGKSVCLIVDELFRIKQRERSPFIAALSPYEKADGAEYYQLATGRVLAIDDGVVKGLEFIEAPVSNLTIIATTNIGVDFDVELGDPAEAERWLPFQLDTTEANVKRIITAKLEARGFSAALAAKFVALLREGERMKADNFLSMSPTVRTLTKAINLSEKESEIGSHLINISLIWVGMSIDGKPIPEQLRAADTLIKKHFPVR